MDALVDLPAMDRVIGGSRLVGGPDQDLEGDITLPVWFIPNAVSQAGLTNLSTAAPKAPKAGQPGPAAKVGRPSRLFKEDVVTDRRKGD